jgi:pSer/pThr/pTyr-binding forkhead associated (FHA) protein
MAFIIVADSKSQEIDRRELAGAVVIGRSPECDLQVRDILLSRRHCVIERGGETWVVTDLGSKNGTHLDGQQITKHVLSDGDVVRLGRTRICFREGPFVPMPPNTPRAKQRPADPLEAMSGTLSAFRFGEEEEDKVDRKVLENFPRPKPHPTEPRAYKDEKVHAMIAEITSSAWDSVLVETEKKAKTKPFPRPLVSGTSVVTPVFQPELKLSSDPTPEPVTRKQRVIAFLYVALTIAVTAAGVWVISWGW